jgi:hypothetical protein
MEAPTEIERKYSLMLKNLTATICSNGHIPYAINPVITMLCVFILNKRDPREALNTVIGAMTSSIEEVLSGNTTQEKPD